MNARNERAIIEAALDATKAEWSGVPRIDSFRFELGEDLGGDPAVTVTVLLDEQTRDEDWTVPNLNPIRDIIERRIEAGGVERWVYVRFIRPSDLQAVG